MEISVISGRYIRHGVPKWITDFRPGVIKTIGNKGKMIWIELKDGRVIKIVPAMTGFLVPADQENKYVRLHFKIGGTNNINLVDQRNFATIYLLNQQEFEAELERLGPFPLDLKSWFIKDAVVRLRGLRGTIADALLDQRGIAGIGNYLRSEVLYCAGIAPMSKVSLLTTKELTVIAQCASRIMRSSYKWQLKHGFRTFPFKAYENPKMHVYYAAGHRRVWWDPEKQTEFV